MWERSFSILSLAIVAFALACVLIAADGLRDRVGHADVGVVLGNRVLPNGTPSRRLRARLDKAVELHRRGFFPVILVSGGIDPDGQDEARVMRDYLVAHGVPASRIAMDRAGNNTRLTALHTREWLAKHGGSRALAISQYFHVPRCRLAFRQAGVARVYSTHANVWEWRDLYSTPREVVGWLRYATAR